MGQARSTALFRLCLVSLAWVATGPEAAQALVGVPPVEPGLAAVELSARVRHGERGIFHDPWSLPVLFCAGSADYAPVSHAWQSLEGDLSPLEESLFADAADGRWDEFSLLGAALVASGVVDVEPLSRYQAEVAELVAELERSGRMTGSPLEKAAALFELMHCRILHAGYQIDATDLTLAVDQGRYNCVSASVLFNCLAARFGLCVRGLEIPGHAMSRLILPDGTIDVETTCPGWFRLMHDPKKQAELVEKTIGPRPAEGSLSAEPREVSDVELVATIYYNRGVDLLAEKKFAQAVAANAKALRLDPLSTTARGNLLATINNWAVDLGSAGRHAEAVELLRQGIVLDSDYETFKVNYVHVHSQWIEDLCGRERFREALDLAAEAAKDGVDEAYFAQAGLEVYRRWARTHLEAGQADQAFAVFDEASRLGGGRRELLEAEAAEVSQHALDLVRRGQPGEAVTLLDRALARQPGSTVLEAARREAVIAWALLALQKGDYAEAIRRTTHNAAPGRLHDALADNVRDGYYQWISQLLARGRRLEARRIARQAMADPFLAGRVEAAIPPFVGKQGGD